MRTVISGARVVDPGQREGRFDLMIEDGRIAAIDKPGSFDGITADCERIDAAGLILTPGLIDLHVHLREPGHEYKETIATGSRAAARGGFCAVCAMPNTQPVNDNRQVTEFILAAARRTGAARVYPVAAISRGLAGQCLSDYGELREAGAVAVSDDGRPVMDSQLMRRALEYARGVGLPVVSHCEDLSLAAGGQMNEGELATRLGLAGIPNVAESIMVERDIALCELTGAHLHIAHVSTLESVRAIRAAKTRGVPVTAETAPHYFSLTDAAVEAYDTHAKMNPPLRSPRDREAVREGLADGTIDAIATDHAPHAVIEKDVPFDQAANGIIGLETALPVSLTLVTDGVLTLSGLVEKMASNPARILSLDKRLIPGNPADVTLLAADQPVTIDAQEFSSLSRNTPFDGWTLKGRALLVMVQGHIVFDNLPRDGDGF